MILLARHGETDDNREPIRIQGSVDTPLNDTGRAQAARLAERVAPHGLAAIYTSALSRASETAAIVGAHLGLEPIVDPRFAESYRGELEGMLWQDIEREDPEIFAAWRAAGPGFRFPGGESMQEHADRVLAGLTDVEAGALPALVVCHGGSIRVALCSRDPRGLAAFHEYEIENAAVMAW